MFTSFTSVISRFGLFFTSCPQRLRYALRRLGAVIALSLPLLAASGPIKSGLIIEPGQQFVLGGGQRGAFRVKGTNSGLVTVRVVERFAAGDTLGRGVLRPGAKADLPFKDGSAALLVNLSTTQKARLDLRISGASELGMSYEVAPAKK